MILGIYGSGGAGRGCREIAELQNEWSEIIFIDDTVEADTFKGLKRMPFDQFKKTYSPQEAKIIIAMGEPIHKVNIYNKVKSCGYSFANVIHPRASVSPSAVIGNGIIAQIGAVIGCDVTVEDNVTLQQYAVVAHDSVIHKHSQISAFVMISGKCEIGEATYIANHVPVREKIKIGSNSIIGMGSVVLRDIPDKVIAMGNPARPMKKITDDDRVFQ